MKNWHKSRNNRCQWHLGLNNWTFGIYWGRLPRGKSCFGIDLGPFEVIWNWGGR